MRAVLALLLAGAVPVAMPACALDAPSAVLAHAAVDPTLFREGAVRRRNEAHGRWSLDCDEVPHFAQRFCSLRTLAVDAAGTAIAKITISTDDTGRPAALLAFPPALDLREPVTVTAASALIVQGPSRALLEDVRRRAARQGDGAHGGAAPRVLAGALSARLRPSVCEPTSCQTVWPLSPSDIAALRAGSGLRIAFQLVTSSQSDLRSGRPLTTRAVEGLVSSDGFDDAIKSSVR